MARSSTNDSGEAPLKLASTIMERLSFWYTNSAERPPPKGATAGCPDLSTVGQPAAYPFSKVSNPAVFPLFRMTGVQSAVRLLFSFNNC